MIQFYHTRQELVCGVLHIAIKSNKGVSGVASRVVGRMCGSVHNFCLQE